MSSLIRFLSISALATAESFIVARRPAGVRPGMPSTLLLGFRWNL